MGACNYMLRFESPCSMKGNNGCKSITIWKATFSFHPKFQFHDENGSLPFHEENGKLPFHEEIGMLPFHDENGSLLFQEINWSLPFHEENGSPLFHEEKNACVPCKVVTDE
jgi:hypothetical protein